MCAVLNWGIKWTRKEEREEGVIIERGGGQLFGLILCIVESAGTRRAGLMVF